MCLPLPICSGNAINKEAAKSLPFKSLNNFVLSKYNFPSTFSFFWEKKDVSRLIWSISHGPGLVWQSFSMSHTVFVSLNTCHAYNCLFNACFPSGVQTCLSFSPLSSWGLTPCLAHDRHPVNICWINGWMNEPAPVCQFVLAYTCATPVWEWH